MNAQICLDETITQKSHTLAQMVFLSERECGSMA